MKKGWEIKRLGEVLNLEYGKPLPESKRKSDGAYPVYGANGEKDRTDEYFYDKQSIIVGRKGSAGEINLTEKKFWPLDVTYFVTFDKNKFDLYFLYYLLGNLELPKLAKGVKPGINRNEVFSKEVQIPPLPEQQRIVAILDEAFDAIAKAKEKAEKNLQNARELFDSYLQSVFANPGDGWEEKRLGEVCTFQNGFAFKSKDAVTLSKTQLIRMSNLYQNKLDLERRPVYYPDEFFKSHKKFLLEEGDLIISLTGTTGKQDYGFTVKIPKINKNILLNQRIAKIIILDEKRTVKDYFFHFLLSRTFLDKLYNTANGTRQANLSTEAIKEISILMPEVIEQRSIIAKLDALSAETKKLEAIYEKKLDSLEV